MQSWVRKGNKQKKLNLEKEVKKKRWSNLLKWIDDKMIMCALITVFLSILTLVLMSWIAGADGIIAVFSFVVLICSLLRNNIKMRSEFMLLWSLALIGLCILVSMIKKFIPSLLEGAEGARMITMIVLIFSIIYEFLQGICKKE